MNPLTHEMIMGWFAKKTASNYNCFNDWNFLTNMCPEIVLPAEGVPYMNALNYFRRYETNFTGMRFFDLKRWGMEYSHEYGLDNEVYFMAWNDPRRALEVPQDAIASGLQPSRPLTVDSISTQVAVPAHTFEPVVNDEE